MKGVVVASAEGSRQSAPGGPVMPAEHLVRHGQERCDVALADHRA